jgi:16S rRNA (cytidine1402-2'-O)-methyltransferase
LWIVATPIGTLADLAPRALEVLTDAELILVEDTRRARRLLGHFGVSAAARLQSFHEHNEEKLLDSVVERITAGARVALLSDAGTPALSDPGYLLVRRLRELGLTVCSVPGPSAFSTALAASGQPPLPATLVGFLPARKGARRRRIEELTGLPWTLVFLLSPHRLAAELADLRELLGERRPATLLAELSKRYERAQFATLAELAEGPEATAPRGEYVLVVGPPPVVAEDGAEVADEAVRAHYRQALAGGADRKRALRETASSLGLNRRRVYDLVLGRHKE